MVVITQSNLSFLQELSANNNREWFIEHKDRYLAEYENLISFSNLLHENLVQHDLIETKDGKKAMHKIYRDVRFSKDKTPYKTNWSGSFKRATAHRRGGYYFHLEPGNSFIAGGFLGPNSDDLLRIRKGMEAEE